MEIRNLARSLTRNAGFAVILLGTALPSHAAQDVPVPGRCTPQVNQKLGDVIAAGPSRAVDNVMVCGMTVGSSRPQRAGHHEILPLRVIFPDRSERLVEVITDDDLDGVVTAPLHATVFAFGQAFIPDRGHFAAGIHDVYCSTHRTAENGWVVVDGQRHPGTCHL
jgi:hypothetical protein